MPTDIDDRIYKGRICTVCTLFYLCDVFSLLTYSLYVKSKEVNSSRLCSTEAKRSVLESPNK